MSIYNACHCTEYSTGSNSGSVPVEPHSTDEEIAKEEITGKEYVTQSCCQLSQGFLFQPLSSPKNEYKSLTAMEKGTQSSVVCLCCAVKLKLWQTVNNGPYSYTSIFVVVVQSPFDWLAVANDCIWQPPDALIYSISSEVDFLCNFLYDKVGSY